MLNNILTNLINAILSLTAEQITLISVCATLFMFILSRRAEVKFKKQELRRAEYKNFINMLQKMYGNKLKLDDKSRQLFFDTGASLLIYGSKKMYKKYVFFREYSTNPILEKSKYNSSSIALYLIADMLQTIRQEVGMTSFKELEPNEVMSFFVNDIGMNPIAIINSYSAKRDIMMLKFEMFMTNIFYLVHIKKLFYIVISPILSGVGIFLYYLLVMPLGKLLGFLFPSLKKKKEF